MTTTTRPTWIFRFSIAFLAVALLSARLPAFAGTEALNREPILYASEGLKISGLLSKPAGDGPFPLILLNHGGFDPADRLGGLLDLFAKLGYVVIASDYRGIDRTIGELARMHSRIGGFTRLGEILDEIKDRTIVGSATERITGVRQALWMMQNRPEVSFRCGPLALNSIENYLTGKRGANKVVFDSASTQLGFSLSQVRKLSQVMNLNFQSAKRLSGSKVIIPCVVHWKVNHFAAIIQEDSGRYLMTDPTFGSSIWISKNALDEESSGYFLVPAGNLPRGWQSVNDTEAQSVWGRGLTTSSDPNSTTPYDAMAEPDCGSGGMAVYNFTLMLVSLHLEDTPISFQPPRGPRINFTMTYNQREANQPVTFPYSNFGQKWTCNWVSYIVDNGPGNVGDVQYYVGGGGTETFTGYNSTNQTFLTNWRDQAVLTRPTSTNYVMTFPDGSQKVFGQPDGSVGNSRKVFLTQVIDPTGYTNLVQYDSSLRLSQVYDPVAATNNLTFYYNTDLKAGLTNTIQSVTDRYSRSASFGYNGFLFQLTSITDVLALQSSFTYDLDFINQLTTPYGATTFAYGEDGRTRWLEATDPQGAKSRVEYNENTVTGVPIFDPGNLVPQQMYTRNFVMNGRNTFYWDKKAMREAPGNYSKARLYHWLHSPDMASAVGVMESYKEPLENRVWFNYPGQTSELTATIQGTLSLPSVVGRVLDDGSSQFYQYYRNSIGNITNYIDPVGRSFTNKYATNGIDLLEVRMTSNGNNQLLASYTYNNQHLPLTAVDAAGQTNRFGYNTYGQLTFVTNALNGITAFSYDSAGRLMSIDGPLAGTNDTVSFTYDSYDRVKTVTDVSGYTVTNSYDAFDRIKTNAFPDGTTQVYTYTNLDLGTITDRAGRMTQAFYNSLRQLTEVHQATNWVTRYDWCNCGNLSSVTDPLGRMTQWFYDIQGRPTAKQYADGSRVGYTYENTTSRLKALTNEAGQTRNYSYLGDNSLWQIVYANPAVTPTVTFYYDSNFPRLNSMVDGTGSNYFLYYAITNTPTLGAGRLKTVGIPSINSTKDTLTYSYDALGRMTNETFVNTSLGYSPYAKGIAYDASGRRTSVQTGLGSSPFIYAYVDASPRVQSITFPDDYQKITYDYYSVTNDLRLKQINNYAPNTANTLLSQFAYAYNQTGQITNWTQLYTGSTNKVWQLAYDAIDELTNVSIVVSGVTTTNSAYVYDLAGNRTQEVTNSTTWKAGFNSLNQLVNKDTGNSVTDRHFEFDEENRLHKVVVGSSWTTFYYNGFGQPYQMDQYPGGSYLQSFKLTWAGERLIQEMNFNSTAAVYRWYYENGFYDSYSTTSFFLTRDHLGSVREVVRDTSSIPALPSLMFQFDYDAFGRRTIVYTANILLSETVGFTGAYTDPSDNLVLAQHRAYDPDLGRWLSRDPIGEVGGLNLYRYVGNNPINWIDPSGLCAQIGFAGKDGQYRNPNTGFVHNGDGSIAEDQLNPFNSANGVGRGGTIGGGGWSGGVTESRAFWSGGDLAREAAEAFAKRTLGGTTLELSNPTLQSISDAMLAQGKDWATVVRPTIWEPASKSFADGASGVVNVFQNAQGISLRSVWRQIEFPALKSNPSVIIQYHIVMPDGSVIPVR